MTTENLTVMTREDRLAHKMVNFLADYEQTVPHDVQERLRFARQNAVQRFNQQHVLAPVGQLHRAGHGSLSLSTQPLGWFDWLGIIVPVAVLVFGLIGLSNAHDQSRANELATFDVALLTDDLPPSAYNDPGFIRFIKMQERLDQQAIQSQ